MMISRLQIELMIEEEEEKRLERQREAEKEFMDKESPDAYKWKDAYSFDSCN